MQGNRFLFIGLGLWWVLGNVIAFGLPRELLLVVSGGYESCGSSTVVLQDSPYGMGMYTPGRLFIGEAQKIYGVEHVQYIFNCLSSDPPPRGEGAYITSDAPKNILYGNTLDLLKEIEVRLLKNPSLEVILVGHSYGGWLSMFLVLELAKRKASVRLFTIDPISPHSCGPVEVIFGSSGCHQSPKDLDVSLIAEDTQSWINFFQRQDSWINSSSISKADENIQITYRGPHSDIDTDKRVWAKIKSVFLP